MRWEYKRVNLDIADVPQGKFEIELNRLGELGWELVSAIQHERHGYSHEVHLVFKRGWREAMPESESEEDSRAAE